MTPDVRLAAAKPDEAKVVSPDYLGIKNLNLSDIVVDFRKRFLAVSKTEKIEPAIILLYDQLKVTKNMLVVNGKAVLGSKWGIADEFKLYPPAGDPNDYESEKKIGKLTVSFSPEGITFKFHQDYDFYDDDGEYLEGAPAAELTSWELKLDTGERIVSFKHSRRWERGIGKDADSYLKDSLEMVGPVSIVGNDILYEGPEIGVMVNLNCPEKPYEARFSRWSNQGVQDILLTKKLSFRSSSADGHNRE